MKINFNDINKWLEHDLKSLKKNSDLILLVFGLIITFFGFWITFILGFHNFDMAQNMIFIRDDNHISFLEAGMEWDKVYFETLLWTGELVSFEQTYIEGIGHLITGIFTIMLGTTLSGYSIGRLKK